MSNVKILPRGIPQGAQPQKQTVTRPEVVLVGEWSRRVAHELDMSWSLWVAATRQDHLSPLHQSPFIQPFSHEEWLTHYEQAADRYVAVNARRQWVQDVLGETRRQGTIKGHKYSKADFDRHRETLRREHSYLVLLATNLRKVTESVQTRLNQKIHAEARRQRELMMAGTFPPDTDPNVVVLVALVTALNQQLASGKPIVYGTMSPELRAAKNAAQAQLEAVRHASIGEVKLDADDYVLIDGLLARRDDVM